MRDEVAQGEEVMNWRLSWPEACLDRAAQLMLLRPSHQPSVESDCVQSVEGLTHSYGPVVGGFKGAASLVNWSDEG